MTEDSKQVCPVQRGIAHAFLSLAVGKLCFLYRAQRARSINTCLTPNTLLAIHAFLSTETHKTQCQAQFKQSSRSQHSVMVFIPKFPLTGSVGLRVINEVHHTNKGSICIHTLHTAKGNADLSELQSSTISAGLYFPHKDNPSVFHF